MNETVDARALIEYLAAQEDVLAGYLFGSQSTGKAQPTSDVDVAVLLSEEDATARFERRLRLIDEVSNVCHRQADVIVLNDAPVVLQRQVLNDGRLLCERDRMARVAFEVHVGKVYADLQPMRDFFTEDLIQKIKEVGLVGRRRRHCQPTEGPG
jgi:predicted nucleotidyltransferase